MPQSLPPLNTLSRNLVRSFGAMLVVLLALLGFALWNFHRLGEADGWKAHTYQVLLESQRVRDNMFIIDNGVRALIVDGKPENRQTIERGKRDFDVNMRELARLVADNSLQGRRLEEARRRKDIYLSVVAGVVRDRTPTETMEQALQKAGHASVVARINALNDVRATLDGFDASESALLTTRIGEQNRWQRLTEAALWMGSAFAVALTLFLSSVCARAVRQSSAAYDDLQRAVAQLEHTRRGLEIEVAQRREAEEKLQRVVGELRRSNTELEQFAYVASHDLQEPLRAVAGCVGVLKRRYEGKLDARADQFIDHAVEGAQRMQNLIHDLLAYSRVGTKGKPFADVDLNRVVDAALQNLSASIAESGAVIERASLPTIRGDAGQLEQVMQNLLSNAIKFRGEAPPQIAVKSVSTDDETRGRGWTISVSDKGPGIEPQYFERIFVMFQRLHTRTEYPGTGIGLAIVKKIIERHGGHIGVESEVGEGTTFSFFVPEHTPDEVPDFEGDGAPVTREVGELVHSGG